LIGVQRDPTDGVPIGHHLVVEYFGCDPAALDAAESLKNALVTAATDAGTQVIGSLRHQFQPHGVTCILLLAESHLSIHTWPEWRYAAVDFFTCGTSPRPEILDTLGGRLQAAHFSYMTIIRGARLGVAGPHTASQLGLWPGGGIG
jgi:S-adenosylmethionine decarboxylase proenzyme